MERTARMSMREEPPMFPHISGGEPSALGAAASADTDVALEVDEEPMGGSESSAEVGQRSEVTVVMVSAGPTRGVKGLVGEAVEGLMRL
jgi:hypothetical protein